MSTSPGARQLTQLTSLRFFAALAVLSSHLGLLERTDNALHPLAVTVFHEGFAGVTFFYALSGFILSHTWQSRLLTGAVPRHQYLLLRLARIYPLHLLTALPFAVAAFHRAGTASLATTVPNLLLLQSWFPDATFYYSLNSVSWSLSDELFFYSMFVVLVLLPTRALRGLVLGAAAVLTGAVAVAVATGHGHWSQGDALTPTHFLTYIFPVTRLLDFMIGMLIYRHFAARANTGPEAGADTTWHEVGSVVALLAGMAAFSAFQLPEAFRSQLLYLPLVAWLLWSFAAGRGRLSRALGAPWLVLLGEASFALYMVHQKIILAATAWYERAPRALSPVAFSLLVALACIAASVLVYRFVERPVHDFLRRRIARAA